MYTTRLIVSVTRTRSAKIQFHCGHLVGTWWAPVAALHIKCRTASIGTGGPATKRPPDTDRVLVTDTINRVGFRMLPLSRIGSCMYINLNI